MSRLERALHAAVHNEGHTLVAALLRIGLPLLLWARFASELHPMRHVGEWEWWLVAALFYGITPLMFIGLWSRLTTALTGAVLLWMYFGMGIEGGHEPWTHHHVYALVAPVVLLAFTPCGRSLSVDRWLALRRDDAKPERADLWALRLIAFQVSMIYLWGAWDKCRMAFLGGDRLEQVAGYLYLGSDYPDGPALHVVLVALSVATVVLEYALAVLPWFRRTRLPILLLGAVFHAILYWTVPVGTFTLTTILLYLAFFPPDAVAKLVKRLL
ncbi:MAG: HTTM domain-containing protein [Proteobacteria bacterium]|nr:HTTM domain-containing protein [Pseudomonadota bacterium]MCP4920244.1 HTTM domain-containing protein [Pseudomonadota bacterium]